MDAFDCADWYGLILSDMQIRRALYDLELSVN